MASINTYLKDKASEYFISYGSSERQKIDTSINNLQSKLNYDLAGKLLEVEVFGSYNRGTILPRAYDYRSDIDLLVIFNHGTLNYTPGTYRKYLKDFAEKNFSRSLIYKDAPTVVLELNHIKYDLVPCHIENSWFNGKQYYIPQSDSSWMHSDIHGFNEKLTKANTQYSSIVKPIIRLMKAWNSKVGYPIPSYSLEQEIANLSFAGDNYERGFFYAIDRLDGYQGSLTTISKIASLKSNAKRVKACLENDNYFSALSWLGHILP